MTTPTKGDTVNPNDTICTRCGEAITLTRSGNFVTGHDGWILPSHLNRTCDGIHLHIPLNNKEDML